MKARSRVTALVLVLAITAGSLVILWLMGRALICPCGYVRLWYSGIDVVETSQHLLDWYSPSHLLHGILFYAGLWLVARRLALEWRLVLATLTECGWEILENTDAVINRYRTFTISDEYSGDSVINSGFDILAMFIGFWIAWRLPVWVSVAIVVGFEVLTAIIIRDGLTLNVIMLLWPSEAILEWQSSGWNG